MPGASKIHPTLPSLSIHKQYHTAQDVPPSIAKGGTLKGKIVKVIDGDTVKLYHTPGLLGIFKDAPADLRAQTITIRLAGIDAPEKAKLGWPEQPHAEDAKVLLSKLVLNKHVTIKMLGTDPYKRIIGMIYVRRPPFFYHCNVSLKMIKAGMAEMYRAKGANYAGLNQQFEEEEAHAKNEKRGIWAGHHISPGDHRKKYKNQSEKKQPKKRQPQKRQASKKQPRKKKQFKKRVHFRNSKIPSVFTIFTPKHR